MKIFYLISFILSVFLLLPLLISSSTAIKFLPGFNGHLPFELYTGYISVDEKNQNNLFYYFIKSEKNPLEDPLLLWLTGGPGCSALSGVIYEIGPLHFENGEYNGSTPSLVLNPNSWTKFANIIFLDSPIGTGFSYSNDPNGYMADDFGTSKDVHKFLIKWFVQHPEFLSNPLYIAGDSYSGMVVPIIAQEILNGTKFGQNPRLNLKGYIVGNPTTDPEFDAALVPHARGLGLISEELYEATKRSCGGKYANPRNAECAMNINAVNECLSGINRAYILEPTCMLFADKPRTDLGGRRSLEQKQAHYGKSFCRSDGYHLSYYWANDDTVREALHIQKGTIKEWVRCNLDLNYIYDAKSVMKYHLALTTNGCRALVYSGDHDLIVPILGTESWIKSLNFPIVDDWRSWAVDGQVAGFTRTYSNNLTFATVMGAGHTAPEYRPKECLAMFQRWIDNLPL